MMSRIYSYIGAARLNSSEAFDTKRTLAAVGANLLVALRQAQSSKKNVPTVFTYIVDVKGLLWIADRHSEHVACARGADVLSAGEMRIEVDGGRVLVTDVTNQSTGYCPEPESWPIVASALDKAGITRPDGFTHAFLFRLCEGCGQTNIVKEGNFTCAVCGNGLKQEWNFPHDRK